MGEQTADGVPREAFEALIDLLTSDGVDDAPSSTPTVPRARVTADGAAVRDESGRLDFGRIWSMFEGQNNADSQGGTAVAAGETFQQVLDFPEGAAQTDVVDRRDNVEGTNISKANPVTATVQDLRPDRSEYPDVDGAVPSNDVPPPRDILTTPFLFDQLNDALGSARDEMCTLRRRYDELRRLVAERLGKGKELKESGRKTTQKVVFGAHDSKTCRDATAPSGLRGHATAVRDGTEAGRQITTEGGSDYGPKMVIASMTNVRPSLLLSGDPSSAPFKLSSRTRGNLSPQDISRALDFVERVDEIIWRRSSLPTNSSLNPTFSAGNVEGLLSRLELWEKMVRSPSP
ncbi:hypothetical protein EDD15DRAFT_2375227 [Pisolithus albus]|nr:hypothetical protein EDD15DRAFT_2375227 [Pisolithus albus]